MKFLGSTRKSLQEKGAYEGKNEEEVPSKLYNEVIRGLRTLIEGKEKHFAPRAYQVLEQGSQKCGTPTSRKIQIFIELLSNLAYFLNLASNSKYFESHAARE